MNGQWVPPGQQPGQQYGGQPQGYGAPQTAPQWSPPAAPMAEPEDDAWEETDSELEKSGSGMFIKLETDGARVNIVFLGAPKAKHGEYQGEQTLRFDINVWDMDAQAVKIFTLNKRLYKMVRAYRENLGNFGRWVFTVVRQGAKGDSKTTYTMIQQNVLDDQWMAFLKSQQLFKLGGKPTGENPAPAAPQQAYRPPVAPTQSLDYGWQHQQAIATAPNETALGAAVFAAQAVTDPSLHPAIFAAANKRAAELQAGPPAPVAPQAPQWAPQAPVAPQAPQWAQQPQAPAAPQQWAPQAPAPGMAPQGEEAWSGDAPKDDIPF